MATSKRGFASMDASKQREIASKGGRAAHAKGTAHEFTSDEARVAGRKGGEAVSRDRAHMAAIGREGGHSRGARARAAAAATGGGSPLGVPVQHATERRQESDISQNVSSQPFVRQANEESRSSGNLQERPSNNNNRSDMTNEGNFSSSRDRF
jgi:general stress protein YciG